MWPPDRGNGEALFRASVAEPIGLDGSMDSPVHGHPNVDLVSGHERDRVRLD
jgi:hypothetical protein